MVIRFACAADIPGMLSLLRQVGRVHHQIRPDIFRCHAQKYDEAALLALLQDPGRPIFIAEQDGTVAGYCFCVLERYRGDSVMTDRLELYIDDLCVDECCRNRGIATELYRTVCGFARELGCHSVTLNVWSGNDSAMDFYEKMGMKPRKIGMEMLLEESEC